MKELEDIRQFLVALETGWSGSEGEVFGSQKDKVILGIKVLIMNCDKISEKLNEQSSSKTSVG